MRFALAVAAAVTIGFGVGASPAAATLSHDACQQAVRGNPGDHDANAEQAFLTNTGHVVSGWTWDGWSRAGDWTIDQWVRYTTDDGVEIDRFRCHDGNHSGVVASDEDWLDARGPLVKFS